MCIKYSRIGSQAGIVRPNCERKMDDLSKGGVRCRALAGAAQSSGMEISEGHFDCCPIRGCARAGPAGASLAAGSPFYSGPPFRLSVCPGIEVGRLLQIRLGSALTLKRAGELASGDDGGWLINHILTVQRNAPRCAGWSAAVAPGYSLAFVGFAWVRAGCV